MEKKKSRAKKSIAEALQGTGTEKLALFEKLKAIGGFASASPEAQKPRWVRICGLCISNGNRRFVRPVRPTDRARALSASPFVLRNAFASTRSGVRTAGRTAQAELLLATINAILLARCCL